MSVASNNIDRTVLRTVIDLFAASKSDLTAETGFSKSQINSSLRRLVSRGQVTGYDVNDAAQGDRRRGQFKEIVFQSLVGSIDELSADDISQLVMSLYPVEEATVPATAKRTRKSTADKAKREAANARRRARRAAAKAAPAPMPVLSTDYSVRKVTGQKVYVITLKGVPVVSKSTGKPFTFTTRARARKALAEALQAARVK